MKRTSCEIKKLFWKLRFIEKGIYSRAGFRGLELVRRDLRPQGVPASPRLTAGAGRAREARRKFSRLTWKFPASWGGKFTGEAGKRALTFALHIQIKKMLPYSTTELNCTLLQSRNRCCMIELIRTAQFYLYWLKRLLYWFPDSFPPWSRTFLI